MAGCSPPSFVAQRYTNFTAYYNTFYNAQEAFESGLASLESSNAPVDRDRYLPVFVPPSQAAGGEDFERAIQKGADVLRNHSNSKWVDDALLLIGKSYFYQQNYVGAAQKFREAMALESALEGEARFWLSRSLIQSGAFEAAETHLRASLDEGAASFGRWTAMMHLARGELYARQERWQEAAVALDRGLAADPDQRAAARAAFLLGQVRETLGIHTAAARAYEVVNESYQPRYELSFAAQMSAIRVRGQHGEAEAALERLRRMERDDKNFEKRAEMALLRGQLYKAMGQPDQARRIFRALLYDDNGRSGGGAVRGRVHYALGVLHQDAYDDFSAAAAHFDTAATSLGRPTSSSAETLGAAPAAIRDSRSRADLFRNLADRSALVSRLDSLLRLGRLSDEAFQDVIATLRARRAEEEAARRRVAARRDAAQRFGSRVRTARGGGESLQQEQAASNAGGDASFLFHQNPVQAQEARRSFERRWGQRPLVPNWRRLEAIRSQGGPEPQDDSAARPAIAATEDAEPRAAPSVQVDVSAVPRDSASQAQMRARRALARYEFANALFLTAGRPDSAAVWYQRVLDEDAEQPVARRALYALAEVYQARGDTAAARAAYQQVIDQYPRSSFAQRARQQIGQPAGDDVAPADSLAQAAAAYEQAYTTWEAGGHEAAQRQFIDVAVRHGGTPVAAKALWAATTVFLQDNAEQPRTLDTPMPFVFARVLGAADTTAALQASRMGVGVAPAPPPTLGAVLAHITAQYPETPHAQRAEQMLAALEARTPEPLPADSVRADSSMRADSVSTADSTQVDPTPGGDAVPNPVADSTSADSSYAPAANSVSSDSLTAGAAQPGAMSSTASPDTVRSDTAVTANPPPSSADRSANPAWILIVETHAERDAAMRMQQAYASRMQRNDVSLRVRAVTVRDTARYQVTVGPFASESEAEAARAAFGEWLPAAAQVAPQQ